MAPRRERRHRRNPRRDADPAERAEVEIERLAAGGDGVGHLADGRVLFVPYTAPGDRVRVRLTERRPRFARGEVEALLREGPGRVEPRCEHFGRCGGCSWQHLADSVQVEAKKQILMDAVRRIGRLEIDEIEFTPSPRTYAYRHRSRVLVDGSRAGYRRNASHELCAVRRCPVLVAELEGAFDELLRKSAAAATGGASETEGEREWELAAAAGVVRISSLGPPAAAPRLAFSVGGDLLSISPGVFVQANAALFEELARAVVGLAREGAGGGTALELFAGAGFLTLGLARAFDRVVAVERDADAVRDLRDNLGAAGLHNVEVKCDVASPSAPMSCGEAPEVVVLDPPRQGLEGDLVAALASLAARRIVYLSCDPATLARDCRLLCDGGWVLRSLRGFDLFPQTPHVEAVAVLERPAR